MHILHHSDDQSRWGILRQQPDKSCRRRLKPQMERARHDHASWSVLHKVSGVVAWKRKCHSFCWSPRSFKINNNWFIYGNTYDRAKNKSEYWQVRFLAKILNRIAPMFSYDSCSFNNLESKNTTARVVVGKDIGILNCFTLESSFNAFKYFNMKNKRFWLWKYTVDDYHMMGEFLVKGFFATIKAFYDDEDGIEYNAHTNKNNRELADNSIIVNTLARKAHAEIIDSKPLKHKLKLRV